MEKSESIKNLAAALVKFQGKIKTIAKTADNPFFNSKYATLADVISETREPLAANGLSVTQFPSGEDCLTTILMHTSGEYIMDSVKLAFEKRTPQGQGGAIKYMRRYAYESVLALVTDEPDDNGNVASGLGKTETVEQVELPKKFASDFHEQLHYLIYRECEGNPERYIHILSQCTAYKDRTGKMVPGVTRLEDLSVARARVSLERAKADEGN